MAHCTFSRMSIACSYSEECNCVVFSLIFISLCSVSGILLSWPLVSDHPVPNLSCTGVCHSSSSPSPQQEEWVEGSVQHPGQAGDSWIILQCVRMCTRWSVGSARQSSRGCAPWRCRRSWWRGPSGSAGSTGTQTVRMASGKSVNLGEQI